MSTDQTLCCAPSPPETAACESPSLERRRRLELGEISEMMIVMVIGLFLVVGLVVDGGAKMTAASHAYGLAQGAARAGAQQIGSLPTDGHEATIDPARAVAAAQEHIDGTDWGTGTARIIDGSTLEVTVTVVEPTTFLGLIGINSVTATRTVEVELLHGPDQEAPR